MVNRSNQKDPGTERTGKVVLTSALIVGLIVVLGGSLVLLGRRQFVLLHHYDRINQVEEDLMTLNQEIRELNMKLKIPDLDLFWTEKIARENMNFSAPGELIFRFQDSGSKT